MKTIFANPGFQFIFRFISLFTIFYFGTYFWIGLSASGGTLYSPFIERSLNYITWLRTSILYGGNVVSHLLGLKSTVVPPFLLKLDNGLSVKMVYSCIGIGVMSFWSAFVIANKLPISKKIVWTLLGLFGIWFINCCRIAFLLYVLQREGNVNRFGEHHTVFNALLYALVLIMVYLFTRKANPADQTAPNTSPV